MNWILHRMDMGWKFFLTLSLPLLAMTWFAATGALERQHATLLEQVAAASHSLGGQAADMTRLTARLRVGEILAGGNVWQSEAQPTEAEASGRLVYLAS